MIRKRQFYALDLDNKQKLISCAGGEDAAIKKYRIKEAEKDGTLEHSASTYIIENDDLVPGVNERGPRVIDFANILKYELFAAGRNFADYCLKLFKEAMGSPVEIEYAIDLEPAENGLPTFYLFKLNH